MFDQAARFTGAVPTNYDTTLGPYLFADYAADLAGRVAADRPTRVLEIAAGTGIVTRLLRDALPNHARLVASDLNIAMLDVARQKFNAGEPIEFRRADATALPFADSAFDAVVCQFGVMFFADKDRAYREAFRVLGSGGRYHFNVWDSFACNLFARVAQETLARLFVQDVPAFFMVPFGYHRIDPIKASLIAAGFIDISASVVRIKKTIPRVRSLAEGLILGNPIITEINARGSVQPTAITAALAASLQREFGQGPGRLTLQAIVFRACRP